jgi:alpha-glucosidase/alpha-D-xyloside xylohydrolase
MQRYGSFLWSGDVNSQWETLRNHVPIAVNTGLTGIPYWGTDIGGFVPTKELTGELYVRWFQFAAFNTLCRSHGRTWMLRLPLGGNTGGTGPSKRPTCRWIGELHNAQVEPICRKYSNCAIACAVSVQHSARVHADRNAGNARAVAALSGDPKAARGDQFLWGRDVLVAPVVEQGATERSVSAARRLV